MKHEWVAYAAFWFAVAVGFYSCNKYDTLDTNPAVQIEREKTKQLELQLKLKTQ